MAESNWKNRPNYVPLPADWESRRQKAKQRAGGICEHKRSNGRRCTSPGVECDHIIPRTSGGSSEPDNLAWLCRWHHREKTQGESAAARRAIRDKTKHPVEQAPMRRR